MDASAPTMYMNENKLITSFRRISQATDYILTFNNGRYYDMSRRHDYDIEFLMCKF